MEELVTYPTSTEAEVARAVLEDAGIQARVADWSAMNELMDYRVFVPSEDLAEAAEILGVPEPAGQAPLPDWLPRLLTVLVVLLVAFLIWGLLGA